VGKRLRGTPLDPFGMAKVRRIERALAAEYTDVIDRLADALEPSSEDTGAYDTAVAVAKAAELVRGYEDVKLASVERYLARRSELSVPLGDGVLGLLS